LSLSAEYTIYSAVIFYHNKSANSILSHDFSTKRTVYSLMLPPPIAANGPRQLRHAAPVGLLEDAQGIVFGEVVRTLHGDVIIVLRLPQEVAELPWRRWRLQGFSLQDRPQCR
jgi:hypothetical protein